MWVLGLCMLQVLKGFGVHGLDPSLGSNNSEEAVLAKECKPIGNGIRDAGLKWF